MEFSGNNFLLLSALALLFLSSNAISPSPMPSPSSEDSDTIVVVNDVRNNKTVLALCNFAIDEANKNGQEGESMVFVQVFMAKYFSSYEGIRYFLNINVTKTQDYKKIEGNFLGYVYVTPYSKMLQSWKFEAARV